MRTDLAGKTILLMENEALIALASVKFLKNQGLKIINAYNAQDAITYVEDRQVDLILMDIDLGKGSMEGTKAAELILKNHDLPIVFYTSHSEKEYVDKVRSIVNYGYVIKNSGEFVLLETVRNAFELFHSCKEQKTADEALKNSEAEYATTLKSSASIYGK